MPRRRAPLVIDMPSATESMLPADVRQSTWINGALLYGFAVLLMTGPLAFGTTGPWSQFFQQTLSLTLIGFWVARSIFWQKAELSNIPAHLPAVLFFVMVILQFVTGQTAYRYATLSAILNLIPCGAALLISGELFARRRNLRNFMFLMSSFGFVVAVFALMQDFTNSDRIYWVVKVRALSASLYGPYANHNHYAGLMEMLVPLAAAAAFLERGAKRSLLLFFSTIMAVSIVFSRSRGGILGLGVGVVFVVWLMFRMNRNRRTLLAVLGIAMLVVTLAVFLGNDKVIERMTETQDNYRVAIYSDSLHMWWQKPVLGFGFGTFPTVYPAYRSFYTNLFINHAHNDYLELLVETGVVGFGLLMWFLVGVFRSGFRKIFDRGDHEGGILAIGLLTGIVSLLIHSFLDFNLHIAANAAIFFCLCSAAATPYRHHVKHLEFIDPREEEDPIPLESNA